MNYLRIDFEACQTGEWDRCDRQDDREGPRDHPERLRLAPLPHTVGYEGKSWPNLCGGGHETVYRGADTGLRKFVAGVLQYLVLDGRFPGGDHEVGANESRHP